MLTRCPDCATIFRVHTEQLKARQGRVRCGACQRVFNALDSLIEEIVTQDAELANVGATAPPASAAPPRSAIDELPPAPAAADGLIDPVAIAVLPAPTFDADFIDVGTATPAPAIADGASSAATNPVMSARAALSPDADAASAPSATGDDSAYQPALHEETSAEAGNSRVGWLWASGIVVAIVALLAQALLLYRVELATLIPASRPWFVAACEALGCRVDLPRKIELLTIESSDLNPDVAFPDERGRLRLHVTLRNRAPFAQEWPALELTLTDTDDRALIRRVLLARDYLRSAPPAGIAARQEVAVDLALDTGRVVASGYRLYLFYP